MLASATAVFFVILGMFVFLNQKKPDIQKFRVESAISKGDTDLARKIAGRMENSDLAQQYHRQCDYLDGVASMEKEDWTAAVARLAATGGYLDANELMLACEYRMAEILLEQGEYEQAAAAFQSLEDYNDSVLGYVKSTYQLALQLEQQGDAVRAAMLFQKISAYQDSQSRAALLAIEITGISDGATALASLSGLSAEDVARIEKLEQLRTQWPEAIIDLGFYHTVGLRSDGTVLACGDDQYGQCQVSGWSDIRSVSAGAYHTVGLRADGTVVVAGRNREGQCDVSEWKDIVAVAAADYATYGLCADGSVVCTGDYSQMETAQWKNIAILRTGSYAVSGLSGDGRARIHPELVGADRLTGIVDIALNTGYAVGLNSNGTVTATSFALENWSDIVRISASSTCVLGLDSEGRIFSKFFRTSDCVDFSKVENAVAVCAGGTHFAVVYEDGRVQVFGDGSRGQCDTAQWDLLA